MESIEGAAQAEGAPEGGTAAGGEHSVGARRTLGEVWSELGCAPGTCPPDLSGLEMFPPRRGGEVKGGIDWLLT